MCVWARERKQEELLLTEKVTSSNWSGDRTDGISWVGSTEGFGPQIGTSINCINKKPQEWFLNGVSFRCDDTPFNCDRDSKTIPYLFGIYLILFNYRSSSYFRSLNRHFYLDNIQPDEPKIFSLKDNHLFWTLQVCGHYINLCDCITFNSNCKLINP